LRIGLFCELVTRETLKETYRNRNSLACLRNASCYSAESYGRSMGGWRYDCYTEAVEVVQQEIVSAAAAAAAAAAVVVVVSMTTLY